MLNYVAWCVTQISRLSKLMNSTANDGNSNTYFQHATFTHTGSYTDCGPLSSHRIIGSHTPPHTHLYYRLIIVLWFVFQMVVGVQLMGTPLKLDHYSVWNTAILSFLRFFLENKCNNQKYQLAKFLAWFSDQKTNSQRNRNGQIIKIFENKIRKYMKNKKNN